MVQFTITLQMIVHVILVVGGRELVVGKKTIYIGERNGGKVVCRGCLMRAFVAVPTTIQLILHVW